MKLRRERYGLVISTNAVAGVCVAGGTSRRCVVALGGGVTTTSDAVADCLARLRDGGTPIWEECVLLLAPSLAQVVRIPELPAARSSEESMEMLQHVATEHFLGVAERWRLVVAQRSARETGAWVMTVDRDVLDGAIDALASQRVHVRAVLPVIDVCAANAAPSADSVAWTAGDGVAGHATVSADGMTKAWRSRVPTTLGEEALYAAAVAGAALPVSARFRSADWSARLAPVSPLRRSAPFVVAILSTFIATGAPGVRARAVARDNEQAIAALSDAYSRVQVDQKTLDSLRGLAQDVHALRRTGVAGLRILSQIGEALGDEALVTGVTADSAAVQALVVAPSATALLTALSKVDGVDSVSVVGAVTRDAATGAMQTVPGIPGQLSPTVPDVVSERIAVRFVSRVTPVSGAAPSSLSSTASSTVAEQRLSERGQP
jgi:type II secretory pathway pseudopilin PulG